MALKLITEGNHLNEMDAICEKATGDSKKIWYIVGSYSEVEAKNRNNRIYPRVVFEKEVKAYNDEYIKNRIGYGELEHPVSNAHSLNSDNVCMLCTELHMDANRVMGKSRVLDTPKGLIVQAMLEGGGRVSVSSRGLGTLDEKTSRVNPDFRLLAWDAVLQPSSYSADFVEGILEKKEYIVKGGQIFESAINHFQAKLDKNGTRKLKEDLGSFLRSIRL